VRVLFSSTWGYGHVLPMVPLARAFAAAGHTVHWAASGDAGDVVTAAGLDAVPAGLDGPGVADVQRRLREALSTVRPQDKAAVAFPTMFGEWVTPPMVRDLLPLARELQPDLLVHEHAEHAAPLVGAVLGVPSVTHSFGGAVPPAFLVEVGERLGPLWSEHGLTPPPYAGAFTGTYLDICPPAVQTVPEPPWETTAAQCGRTSAWLTQRATVTWSGTGPRAAGSPSGPTVTSTRASRPARPSTADRSAGAWLLTVPRVR
jgi:hypothetical protein